MPRIYLFFIFIIRNENNVNTTNMLRATSNTTTNWFSPVLCSPQLGGHGGVTLQFMPWFWKIYEEVNITQDWEYGCSANFDTLYTRSHPKYEENRSSWSVCYGYSCVKIFFLFFSGSFRHQKKDVFRLFSWPDYWNFSWNSTSVFRSTPPAVKKTTRCTCWTILLAHCAPKSILHQTFHRIEAKIKQMAERSVADNLKFCC